jgi:hypothetical protein
MKREGEIADWHDRNITAGEEWRNSIDHHLMAAEIILLLVSADFLNSDYCYEIEMRKAMDRHEARSACVIPVILRDCDWLRAPFSKLQALPKGAKPVKAWRDRDQAYNDIVAGIRRAASHLRQNSRRVNASPEDSEPPANLLQYWCDRVPQYDSLTAAVNSHLRSRPPRPLICVVHGDRRECHPEFFEKIREKTLPELFGTFYNEEPFRCPYFELPHKWDAYEGNLGKVLAEQLSRETQRTGTPYEQIVALRPARGVIINFLVETQDWPHLKRLKFILDYWAQFPDMPREMTLIVCLNFQYRHRPKLYENWLFSRRNVRLRAAVRNVCTTEIKTLAIAPLQELLAIEEKDAVSLIEHPEVKRFYRFQRSDVTDLFSNEEKRLMGGAMHMEDLVKGLRNLHREIHSNRRW